MLTLLRIELRKLLSQRKTWFALAAMNMVGIATLVLLLLPPVAEGIRKSAADMLASGVFSDEVPRRMLAALAVTWAHAFSLLAMLFMPLVTGALFADEFGTGSIQVLLVAPVTRLRVFAAKVLAAWSFQLAAWSAGLLLLAASWSRLRSLDPSFAIEVQGLPLLETLASYALVDASMLAFFVLMGTLASSEGTSFVLCLGGFLGWQFLDTALWLSGELGALPDALRDLLAYDFPRTAGVIEFGEVQAYLSGDAAAFPLRTDLLGANAAWTAALLLVGYLAFRRREQLLGS